MDVRDGARASSVSPRSYSAGELVAIATAAVQQINEPGFAHLLAPLPDDPTYTLAIYGPDEWDVTRGVEHDDAWVMWARLTPETAGCDVALVRALVAGQVTYDHPGLARRTGQHIAHLRAWNRSGRTREAARERLLDVLIARARD